MDRVEHTQQAEAIYANQSSASNNNHDHQNGTLPAQHLPNNNGTDEMLIDLDDAARPQRSRLNSYSRGELLQCRDSATNSPVENVPFRERLSSFGLLQRIPVTVAAGAADEKQNRRMLGLFLRENAP